MVEIEQGICKKCGTSFEIKEIGPYKREYCSDRCRQKAYREREKERKAETTHHNATVERVEQLEQELIGYRRTVDLLQRESGSKTRSEHEVFRSIQDRVAELEQHISGLEQELVEANELIEKLTTKKTTTPLKKSYQDRLTRLGEKLDWPALDIHITIKPGRKNWRVFMINESNDQLIRAIIAAERVEEKR